MKLRTSKGIASLHHDLLPGVLTAVRTQHPVGQGAFHSFTLYDRKGRSGKRFTYVYDCGTTSARSNLTRSIDDLKEALQTSTKGKSRPIIDVLVISHFDVDHFNGARILVKNFRVERVVIPYLGDEELACVVAASITKVSIDFISLLVSLRRKKARLFGVPVTMVSKERDLNAGDQIKLSTQPNPNRRQTEPFNTDRPRIVSGSSGVEIGPSLGDSEDLYVYGFGGYSAIWKLRFWNYQIDSDFVAYVFEELVKIGFPFCWMHRRKDIATFLSWFQLCENRKLLNTAFHQALSKFNATGFNSKAKRGVANLVSLTLYSGPETSTVRYCSDDSGSVNVSIGGPHGWLGTADAPLGELEIWRDFSKHMQNELKRINTVQVPHHGAAPKNGPQYFNVCLFNRLGMNAVISCGLSNAYGHPSTSIMRQLKQSLKAKVQKVHEGPKTIFQEKFQVFLIPESATAL